MNAFMDITDTDLVVALGTHFASLAPTLALSSRAEAAVKGGQTTELLREMYSNINVIFSDSENLEMLTNSLVRAVRAAPAGDRAELTKVLAQHLAAATSHHSTALFALVSVFNGLDARDKTRFDVFENLVAFAAKTNNIEAIAGQLSNTVTWAKEWQLDLAQTRTLYRHVARALIASSHARLGFEHLTRLVATYPAITADVAAEATELLTLALTHDAVFDLSAVLALDAIKAAKGGSDHVALLVKLADATHAGDIQGYSQLARDHAKTLFTPTLVESAVVRKVRLMAIARLFAKKNVLTYAEIATHLSVDVEEVELWVIDGIRAGLVEAKVDEVHREVTVTRTTHPEFTRENWEELQTRLQEWKRNMGDVQRTLDQVKLQVQRTLQGAAQAR